MYTKITLRRYFWILLLALALSACAPAQANAMEVQNTAVSLAWTSVAHTQTARPTATPLPPTFTPTPEITIAPGTPISTQPPIFMITPDAIQVERWKEYETALAKSLLPKESSGRVLCEWVILGRSGQELYVVAVCLGGGRATAPAVIYLGADGSIQNVEIVEYGSNRDFNIQRLFPPDIQKMIYSKEMQIIYEQLAGYLDWRFMHREEPPSIILSTTPTQTP